MKRHHIHMKIETALSMSDAELVYMFGWSENDGPAIRFELIGRKEKGELLIGAENCEGFDPVTGCPGHEIKN